MGVFSCKVLLYFGNRTEKTGGSTVKMGYGYLEVLINFGKKS